MMQEHRREGDRQEAKTANRLVPTRQNGEDYCIDHDPVPSASDTEVEQETAVRWEPDQGYIDRGRYALD